MFTDPQSITIGAVTSSLARVTNGNFSASYSNEAGDVQERAFHQYAKRTRREFRVDLKKLITDPLTPANTVPRSASVSIVVNVPTDGTYTPAEMLAAWKGLNTQLSASTDAVMKAFLGGQS